LRQNRFTKTIGITAISVCLLIPRIFGFNLISEPIVFFGLSYYGLQAISLIARSKIKSIRFTEVFFAFSNPLTITSGPIQPVQKLSNSLNRTGLSKERQFFTAIKYVLWGVAIKKGLSDLLYTYFIQSTYFEGSTSNVNTLPLIIITGFYIFFDFYAYSKLVVGLALLIDIELIDNFDDPYSNINPKAFWKNWHISFSEWLKEYIYIPIGGKRRLRFFGLSLAAFCTFLVSAIWHGFTLNFLVWGGMHFFLFSFATNTKSSKFYHFIIFYFVTFYAWVIFLAPNWSVGISIIKGSFANWVWDPVFILISLLLIPTYLFIVRFFKYWTTHSHQTKATTIIDFLMFMVLICVILLFGGVESKSFLYFNF